MGEKGLEADFHKAVFTPLSPTAQPGTRGCGMTKPDARKEGEQRPETGRTETGRIDPAETAPPEGQSQDIPAQDQGKDQGADLAYDAPPAEGARDED